MSSKLAKRVRELEARLQLGTIEVPLRDGGRAHIRQCDALDVTLACWRRLSARMEGESQPSSRFDGELALLEKAIVVDGETDPILLLGIEALQDAVEPEPASETTTIN